MQIYFPLLVFKITKIESELNLTTVTVNYICKKCEVAVTVYKYTNADTVIAVQS